MATTEMNCLASGGGGQIDYGMEISLTNGKIPLGFKPSSFILVYNYNGTFSSEVYDASVSKTQVAYNYNGTQSTQTIGGGSCAVNNVDNDITINPSYISVMSHICYFAVG